MSKVYSFEDCQPVIKEAFKKAIDHLKETLGGQYTMNATEFAWGRFQDYVEQDIEFQMVCDRCGKVDEEGNFRKHRDYGNICYNCHLEIGGIV